jgi:pyridine nucleotide-disulfide oxidoreductase family protein
VPPSQPEPPSDEGLDAASSNSRRAGGEPDEIEVEVVEVEEIEFAEATVSDEADVGGSVSFLDEEPYLAEVAEENETVEEPPPPPRQLVLIGAGHAHLQILKWWRRRPIPNVELTLVTAFGQAAYSGMLPSTLASLYTPDDMLIDLPKLCDHCGVRLIVDRANRLDPVARVIEFAHQPALPFDVASINIGSVPAEEPLWQAHRILISVKPLPTFLQRFEVRFRELVEQYHQAPGPEMLQIVVVGAGAAGVELALCLEQHKHELELPADVRIVDGNPEILRGFSPSAIRRVEKLLKLRGIDRSLGSPVVDCDDEASPVLVLESGERIRANLVIWAAGASPPMALRGFELPKSDRGFLAARPTLQTTADAPIFVAGDTADIDGYSIPKAGVFAVRQAPILWRNLQNCLADKPLIEYRPQRDFLRVLSCGDGTAILDYKGFSSHSAWAWMLKDRIDRGWVRQFRVR